MKTLTPDEILEAIAVKREERETAQQRIYAIDREIEALKEDFNRANFAWMAKCTDSTGIDEIKYRHTYKEAHDTALTLVLEWERWNGYRLETVSDNEWRLYDLARPNRTPSVLVVMPNQIVYKASEE